MQFKASLVALALAATSAYAQDLSQLPSCASGPALAGIQSTGCGTDIACVCKNEAFLSGLQSQVSKACSPADLAKALSFAQTLCAQYGVTLSPEGGASSTAAPATTEAASSASATAEATTTAVVPVTTESSTVTVPLATGTGGVGPVTNGTVGPTATPTAPIITGAASNVGVRSGLGLLVGAAAAFFAL